MWAEWNKVIMRLNSGHRPFEGELAAFDVESGEAGAILGGRHPGVAPWWAAWEGYSLSGLAAY
jgi:hypothetical protein